jgi:fucose permease
MEGGNKVLVSHGTGEKMKVIAKTPFVHLGGFLAFIYVGIEFTIGSWAVTYIVEVRGGGDDSGYVSSGFFGGLMVGRVLHVFVSWVISEQNAVLVYMVVALGLQVVSRVVSDRNATCCTS